MHTQPKRNEQTMQQAVDLQFRSALTFAYAWVIARVLASPWMDKGVNVTAVLLTYIGIAFVAVVLHSYVRGATKPKAVRALCYIVLGACCAAAPEFW
jgi:hypothetical protein